MCWSSEIPIEHVSDCPNFTISVISSLLLPRSLTLCPLSPWPKHHLLPNLNQNSLHGELPLPLSNSRQLSQIHLAIVAVDTRGVDLADKSYFGWSVGVIFAAADLERVNAVLVDRMGRSEDGAVPVGHADVVALVKAIGTGFYGDVSRSLFDEIMQMREIITSSETLLALL